MDAKENFGLHETAVSNSHEPEWRGDDRETAPSGMKPVLSFETEWRTVRDAFPHGEVVYDNGDLSAKDVFLAHFSQAFELEKTSGVYVLRAVNSQEVLQIHKCGVVQTAGSFSYITIYRKLRTPKKKGMSADMWFRLLLDTYGPLLVEYVILGSMPAAPGYVTAVLLQAFLNEHGRLPLWNEKL